MNCCYARIGRILRCRKTQCFAVDNDFAVIGLVDPGQDLNEGRFACTVFTNECSYLAGVKRNIDIIERADAGKCLGNAAHLQQRLNRSINRLRRQGRLPAFLQSCIHQKYLK